MEVDHLSRHFLRLQASHVVWLPGPPPGPPDADGVTICHKLFAVGAYVEDVQVRLLHHLWYRSSRTSTCHHACACRRRVAYRSA